MPDEPRLTYWDAACFTSYINGDRDRLPHLEAILDEALHSRGKSLVVTSVLSKVEVAFSVQERAARQLRPEEEQRIDELWADTSTIRLVDVHELIIDTARELIRQTMTAGLSLKAADAIHLPTAMHVAAVEFHTYDAKLLNPEYARISGLSIGRPTATQPRLPGQ